jgi:hypothetical protein
MRPTQSDVHVSQPLTNILIAYMQDAAGFVAKNVFPIVPVAHKTNTFYKWTRDDFFRVEAAERAPGSPAESGSFTLSTDTYDAKEYAIRKEIEDPIRDNADSVLDLDSAATEYIGQQLMLKRESVFTSTFFTTSVWTGSTTGGDLTGVAGAPGAGQFRQWDNANSTPIEDIRAQIVAVAEKTGYRPNVLSMGVEVWKSLVDHPDILDRIKYTQKGVVTADLLAGLLGLDKIVVAWSTRNTAVEGATAAYDFFVGKTALLTYSAPAPSLMAPSAGYIFAWTKRFGNGPEAQRIKKYRLEEIESDVVEGQQNFAMKVVAAELGVFFNSAVA